MQPEHPSTRSAREADILFPGEGEMARLCREMDWAATPLGAVEQWPQSLKTAAGMVIAQGIAQSLCWGPELVQVYNDGYRQIMREKHPEGLGRSVLRNWTEIRGEIEPLFQRVLGGETVFFEDLLLRVERNGGLQDAYFTFSYSPVRTESGQVGGALIVGCLPPLGLDPPLLPHAVECRVQGSFLDLDDIGGEALEVLRHAIAVHGLHAQCLEDQHVERSREQFALAAGHSSSDGHRTARG